MGLFGKDKRHKPRGFGYIPRYYDAEKEERNNLLRRYASDGSKDVSTELLKERVKMGLKSRYGSQPGIARRAGRKTNLKVLGIVIILGVISYLYLRIESTFGFIQVFGY